MKKVGTTRNIPVDVPTLMKAREELFLIGGQIFIHSVKPSQMKGLAIQLKNRYHYFNGLLEQAATKMMLFSIPFVAVVQPCTLHKLKAESG